MFFEIIPAELPGPIKALSSLTMNGPTSTSTMILMVRL